jgi:hypothetical protein
MVVCIEWKKHLSLVLHRMPSMNEMRAYIVSKWVFFIGSFFIRIIHCISVSLFHWNQKGQFRVTYTHTKIGQDMAPPLRKTFQMKTFFFLFLISLSLPFSPSLSLNICQYVCLIFSFLYSKQLKSKYFSPSFFSFSFSVEMFYVTYYIFMSNYVMLIYLSVGRSL